MSFWQVPILERSGKKLRSLIQVLKYIHTHTHTVEPHTNYCPADFFF